MNEFRLVALGDSLTYGYGVLSHIAFPSYLAAALRSGMTAGLPSAETGIFGANEAITGAEAAVMVQNALDLQGLSDAEVFAPDWAADAVRTLADYGIALDAERVLTRADAAQVIYQVSLLAPEAPGTRILRITQ